MEYTDNLRKVMSIFARVIRGWKIGKAVGVVSEDPTAKELEVSERMLLMVDMPASYTAFDEGKLDSLIPKKEGLMLVTTGRIGEESLSRLLGVASLPILMPNTRAVHDEGSLWGLQLGAQLCCPDLGQTKIFSLDCEREGFGKENLQGLSQVCSDEEEIV